MSAVYVDASALVKLFKREAETEALRDAIAASEARLSSELIVVEALCTARRLADRGLEERASRALEGVELVSFSESIRNRAAATRFTPPLRALDSIHVATAIEIGDGIDAVIAYDASLCAAARAEGLEVRSPA